MNDPAEHGESQKAEDPVGGSVLRELKGQLWIHYRHNEERVEVFESVEVFEEEWGPENP